MTNATPTDRPIFNAKALAGATLVYNMDSAVGGGYLGAIKYLRTLGLPFANARRLVQLWLVNPPEELPVLPPCKGNPIFN